MSAVLLFILGVLVVAVGVAASIALHELGHLTFAKLYGVKVGQYMIGFGPTIWSRRIGETEYGFKLLPFGGYISMSGMYPPARPGARPRTASTGFFQTVVQDARVASAQTVLVGEEERTFYNLPVWKRIVIMLGGPLMNLVIAVTLFAVLLMGFGTAQSSTTIGSVSACVLPAGSTQAACSASDPAAPGAEAGLQPGDRIVSVNGTRIDSWDQATAIIRTSAGQPLTWVVDRDGAEQTLTVTPLLSERAVTDAQGQVEKAADGSTRTEQVGFVGIGAATVTVPQPATTVVPAVADNVVRVAGVIVNLPQRMVEVAQAAFGGGQRDPNGPVGIVGVGRLAGEIATIDAPVSARLASLLGLVASLNVALFAFNLIPLMPLDGGHVAGAVWEAVRRRAAKLFGRRDPGPVDTAKIIPLTLVVAVLIGGMSLLLAYADIVNPITFG